VPRSPRSIRTRCVLSAVTVRIHWHSGMAFLSLLHTAISTHATPALHGHMHTTRLRSWHI
jgi:hypothetical protein